MTFHLGKPERPTGATEPRGTDDMIIIIMRAKGSRQTWGSQGGAPPGMGGIDDGTRCL